MQNICYDDVVQCYPKFVRHLNFFFHLNIQNQSATGNVIKLNIKNKPNIK